MDSIAWWVAEAEHSASMTRRCHVTMSIREMAVDRRMFLR